MNQTNKQSGVPEGTHGNRRPNPKNDSEAVVRLIVAGLCLLLIAMCIVGAVALLDAPQIPDGEPESGFAALASLLYIWAYVVWIGVAAVCLFVLSLLGMIFSVKAVRRAEKTGLQITAWIFFGLHVAVLLPCSAVVLIISVGVLV